MRRLPPVRADLAAPTLTFRRRGANVERPTLLGNQLYALVAVRIVSTGKASTLALQFINTNGWFAMWKDGKVLPAVPKSQRQNVVKIVNKLRAKCA